MTVLVLHAETEESNLSRRLGQRDYSYFFVLQAFRRLLEGFGGERCKVVTVRSVPETESHDGTEAVSHTVPGQVEAIGEICRRVEQPCVFLCFTPPHSVPTCRGVETIPVFAWEFSDLPDESIPEMPELDWTRVLARHGRAITHSSFAAGVVRKAMGADFPVASIPAPVWDRFQGLGGGEKPSFQKRRLEIRDYDVLCDRRESSDAGPPVKPLKTTGASGTFNLDKLLQDAYEGRRDRRDEPPAEVLSLGDGVVFTAVLNPMDERKNHREIVAAFGEAMRDRADATLVLKLTCSEAQRRWSAEIWSVLRSLPPSSCRIVVIFGLLPTETYRDLIRATHVAVNASAGEGQCLPLMEFMSSGRPAIAPKHTAMVDYVTEDNAWIVETSPQPSTWPCDPRELVRTTSRRVDTGSLAAAFEASYDVVKRDPERYRAMSRSATESLREFCSEQVVARRLVDFVLDAPSPSGLGGDGEPGVGTRGR